MCACVRACACVRERAVLRSVGLSVALTLSRLAPPPLRLCSRFRCATTTDHQDASIFVGVYMCLSYGLGKHLCCLMMLIRSMLLNTIEVGRLATPSEVQRRVPLTVPSAMTAWCPCRLNCTHMFCEECEWWVEKNNSCPLCRAEVARPANVAPSLLIWR